MAEEALAVYRDLGDLKGVVGQLNNLGVNRRLLGDYDGARFWLEQSVSICRELGDRAAIASALSNLADVLRRQGHAAEARASLLEALALFREVDHSTGQAWTLNHLGDSSRARLDSWTKRASTINVARPFSGCSATRWAWLDPRSTSDISRAKKPSRRRARPVHRCAQRVRRLEPRARHGHLLPRRSLRGDPDRFDDALTLAGAGRGRSTHGRLGLDGRTPYRGARLQRRRRRLVLR